MFFLFGYLLSPHTCCFLFLSQIFAGVLPICLGKVVVKLTFNTSGPVYSVLLGPGSFHAEERV